MGSDHYPMITELECAASTFEISAIERYKLHKADWHSFRDIASRNISSFTNQQKAYSTDQKYMHFRSSLIAAAEATIPKTKPATKRKLRGVPYWTAKCATAVQKREQALAVSRSNKTTESYIHYKKQKAICRRTIKGSKRDYWESYCDTLTDSTKLTSVWRMAKSIQGTNSPASIPTLVDGNATCKTNIEKAELFANKFSS